MASELTYGTEEIYCGNLARGLRRRNMAQVRRSLAGFVSLGGRGGGEGREGGRERREGGKVALRCALVALLRFPLSVKGNSFRLLLSTQRATA